MVIRDFNIDWAGFRPLEINSILVINTNTVLSFAVS